MIPSSPPSGPRSLAGVQFHAREPGRVAGCRRGSGSDMVNASAFTFRFDMQGWNNRRTGIGGRGESFRYGRPCCPVVAVRSGVFQQSLHHDPGAGFQPPGGPACRVVADGLDQRDRHHPGRNLPGQRAGRPAGRPGRAAAGGWPPLRAGVAPGARLSLDQRRGRPASSRRPRRSTGNCAR